MMENINKNDIDILLIDDDEDEYIIARDLFTEIGDQYKVHWFNTFNTGLDELTKNTYDICLCDYHLGAENGVDLIIQAMSRNCEIPIILLTGQGDREIDLGAMKAGATDYLDKNKLDTNILERAIRYALERKKSEDKIRFLAYYDQLTHLPNRTLFLDRVHSTLASAKRHVRKFAVMFLDIDNFKRINDTLGHNVGDMLIKEVAERLLKCIRKEDIVVRDRFMTMLDTVARLGGDEFIILLSEINEPENASKVAERIRNELIKPVTLEDTQINVTVSIGISIYPNDGGTIDTLIKNADIAMYNAKSLGKNSFQYFNASMNTTASERLNLESDLNKAIEKNEFLLYYQPIIDVKTKEIFAVEALIRWNHSKKGLISPATFISLAEETGLINIIGEFVINETCRQYTKWRDNDSLNINMCLNISPKQLNQNGFVESLNKILAGSNIPPEKFIIEITENSIIHNLKETNRIIEELKKTGIQISFDDFGSGYSSFNTLKKTSFDYLKIDRSFIMNIPDDKEDSIIVQSLIIIGHSMGLKVVAEGVEKKEQLDFLEEHSCDLMQGFYFSVPQPENDIIKILKNKKI